ncbi:MAG: protein-methionine-sulfoxide reductase catalytic subunit MsrP [Gemmatimonadaceae bacterium]|jgi:sulfoxide reductase catalytic subunit YedY|nr:protein-methionine-sulfoxide reductase catalytic subunit MsrP [Gemmatimonadaceae bacterium]
MLIRRPTEPASSEITPEAVYLDRRTFLGVAGAIGAVAATGSAVGALAGMPRTAGAQPAALEPTPEELFTSYNNFYEFGTDKEDPKQYARGFKTSPWTVQVDGLCRKPAKYALEDFLKPSRVEDRVYRFRCVEAWSAVVPWRGIPLADVIRRADPLPSAKYVVFTTLYDPSRMVGQQRNVIEWPYLEGLRMDEAMHPLAFLATGLYGKTLPPQNGAPLRLVVPWKYGFKNIKSIVRMQFTDRQPVSTWTRTAPQEYGFYANVNPTVDHPRWSQAKERPLGKFFRQDTLMFNGYAEQVASLYAGLDLRRNY